ncbi:SGNH/GDSL hydrolase family protein [Lysinibacillus xylanilyticus]|uniref:SGNH/GDSL hydrolase family protein n=1 Tax=Lysinibacillus xylanilyticus TaxID=582475 RepID=UPI002B254255|nr:SGNH/GDSL hydrolase family protein [Lysinibacillus xylanilyticus]MEB2301397.1 SGNH/GDSL hydrolase family protein [Lysinibacillus xylanilyticus]
MKIACIGDSLTEGRPGVSFFKQLTAKHQHIELDNLGKPGETVKSLHTRLEKSKLDNYDLSFLWIGVNDVYAKLLKMQAQPVTKDHQEFQDYYVKVLEMILASSKHVVLVTPALIGEAIKNTSNTEIKELSSIIQTISSKYTNVSFLNMQKVFEQHLEHVNSSDYINTNIMRVMIDTLFYKNPLRIDRLSKKRGLHLTLDGVHLNSKGAELVVGEYTAYIEKLQL